MLYYSLEYDEENNDYWPLDLFVRLDCGGAEVYYHNKQRGTTERHIDIKVERENGESVLLMPKAINKIIEYIKGLIILSDVLE